MKILYTYSTRNPKYLLDMPIHINSYYVQKNRYYIKGVCQRHHKPALGFTYVYDEATAQEYVYYDDIRVCLHSFSDKERHAFSALILNMKYNKNSKGQQKKI